MSDLTKPDFDYENNVDDSQIENPVMEQIDSDDEPWPEDEQFSDDEPWSEDEQWLDDEQSPDNELSPDDEQWLNNGQSPDDKQPPDKQPFPDIEISLDAEKEPPKTAPNEIKAPVRSWYFTFMCMNIPIIGWFYLMHLAFSKKKTERRNFARAYLLYKLIFLLVAAIILGITIYIGLNFLDKVLAYMEML